MRELACGNRPTALTRSLSSFLVENNCTTIGQGVVFLHKYLFKYHRSEFIYKSILLNKIVFGRHSPHTCTAFEELPIGDSIADFVIINGNATVYEIKTDLDTLRRLDAQVFDYYSAFENVVIVCGNTNYGEIAERYRDSSLGIIVLSDRGTLSVKQKPSPVRSLLSHKSMFNILRKAERDAVLEEMGVKLNPVAPVFHYEDRLKKFEKMPLEDAYESCIKLLKRRGRYIDAGAIESLPRELWMLGYFTGITSAESDAVNGRLSKSLL